MDPLRITVSQLLGDATLEKHLFNGSLRLLKTRVKPKTKEEYTRLWKQIYSDLCYENLSLSKEMNHIVKHDVKQGTYEWESCRFDDLKKEQEEEDAFISNPIEVEEGVVDCGKCKSKKTYSYQLQTRSGDEGITSFVQCISCGNKWRM